ncbi:MAG: hypothetical protein ACK4Q5_00200 [Saprospiraceae bacterium]
MFIGFKLKKTGGHHQGCELVQNGHNHALPKNSAQARAVFSTGWRLAIQLKFNALPCFPQACREVLERGTLVFSGVELIVENCQLDAHLPTSRTRRPGFPSVLGRACWRVSACRRVFHRFLPKRGFSSWLISSDLKKLVFRLFATFQNYPFGNKPPPNCLSSPPKPSFFSHARRNSKSISSFRHD